jgi:hypothetical protein
LSARFESKDLIPLIDSYFFVTLWQGDQMPKSKTGQKNTKTGQNRANFLKNRAKTGQNVKNRAFSKITKNCLYFKKLTKYYIN